MNSYSLVGNTILNPMVTPNSQPLIRQVVQCFAHASLFGVNVTTSTKYASDIDVSKGLFKHSVISFELPYSLSPILGSTNNISAIEGIYDSASQATREYIDRPYPRSGNMVAFLVFGDDTQWRKDVDNFLKIPFCVFKTVFSDPGKEDEYQQAYLILATVNSGLSDFYEPLKDYTSYMEIVDAERTISETAAIEVNKLNQTILSDMQNVRPYVGSIPSQNRVNLRDITPMQSITTPSLRKML